MRVDRDVTNSDGTVVNIAVTFSSGGTEISINPTHKAGGPLHLDLTHEEAATLYDLMSMVRRPHEH